LTIISVKTAAELAKVTPGRVRYLILRGTIRADKIGNSWGVYKEDLLKWLEKKKAGRPRRKENNG